jgi:hypothetical protein
MKFGDPAYVSIIGGCLVIYISQSRANAQTQGPNAYSVSAWDQW